MQLGIISWGMEISVRDFNNFTLPLNKRKRIAIPFSNIEFDGFIELGLIGAIMAVSYFLSNELLKHLLGELASWIALAVASILGTIVYITSQNVDKKSEKNVFKKIYYEMILKYVPIKNERGEVIYLNMKKKKGVIYHVYPQPLRLQKHRKRV